MLTRFSTEFVYQLFSLLIAIIIVHAIYVAVIRPHAEAFLEEEAARMAADKDYVARRNVYVFSQGLRTGSVLHTHALGPSRSWPTRQKWAPASGASCNKNWSPLAEGMRILPEDTRGRIPADSGLAKEGAELPATSHFTHRFAPLQFNQKHPGRVHGDTQHLPIGIGTSGCRTVNGSIHRVGNSIDRVHRYGPRYWRSP